MFNPHRHSLHAVTLEALLFLIQNRELWNAALVAVKVNERDEEVVAEEDQGAENDEDEAKDDEWE